MKLRLVDDYYGMTNVLSRHIEEDLNHLLFA